MPRPILAAVALIAGCDLGTAPPTGSVNDPLCSIQAQQEHAPGYPYDLPTFRDQVLPMVKDTCAKAGCHAAPLGQGGMTIWSDAAPGNCSYAKTFNSFTGKLNPTNPTNSDAYIAVTGGNPAHPLKLGAMDPAVLTLLDFLNRAQQALAQSGGAGVAPPPSASPYDYNVFQMQIEPILDRADGKGCSALACHGAPMGLAGFQLVREPAPGSPGMLANFMAVTAISSLQTPDQSKFYLQATHRHGNGASALVSRAEAQTILAWLQQAAANAGPQGSATCPPASDFNESVFTAEILPILLGKVDLNDRSSNRTTVGCARTACHGADRTGGALVLKETWTAAQNLQSFACFVNLTQPVASDVLLCPLNQPGCRHYPHPGQNVFAGPQDLNYQRVLSYLYAAKTGATPLDFAFFARVVNVIFDDPAAVQGGAQNRSCADVVSCHGVTIPGQRAPNGSNFPILANASDKTRLAYNFGAASNFINFIQPTGSSLFLYPTDEIANLANPYATGLHHPGGADFAVDSPQARSILAWAHGLRPDGQGFQPNWLVAGDYPAVQINDATAVDEPNGTPSLFDPDGAAQFNGGQWDGLFAPTQTVDLGQAFPRAPTSRIAYAVAYLLNSSPADISAQITITSPNAVKLYVGKTAVVQADNAGNGVTGLAQLPAFSTSRQTTRILLKVLQRSTDTAFQFTVRLQDAVGNPLTDATGELIIKLSPDGGI